MLGIVVLFFLVSGAYFGVGCLIAGFVLRHSRDSLKLFDQIMIIMFYPFILASYIVLIPGKIIYSWGEKLRDLFDRIKSR